MKKIVVTSIALLLITTALSISIIYGRYSLFVGTDDTVNIKPFVFKPVAKFVPPRESGMRQIEGNFELNMVNSSDSPSYFTAEMDYLGPTDVSYWSFVKFCFFGCCYGKKTSPTQIESGATEEISFQFAPPNKSNSSSFGAFAQSKLTLNAKNDESIKDEIYFATVHIPYTQVTLPVDSNEATIEKCATWDPLNKDKMLRYPLTKTTKKLDQPATIVNDRTYIPLRALAEEMYSEVGWDSSSKTASFTIGDSSAFYKMELQIDNPIAICTLKTIDDVTLIKKIEMPTPAIILNGRTVVPVRSLGETLMGGEIEWNSDTRTVTLYLPPRLTE